MNQHTYKKAKSHHKKDTEQERQKQDIQNIIHNEQVAREANNTDAPDNLKPNKYQNDSELTAQQQHHQILQDANIHNQNNPTVAHAARHGVDIDHSNKVSSAESAHNPRQELDKQDLNQSKKDILKSEDLKAHDANIQKHGYKQRPSSA